ncbi:MAG: FAD binding domain-containing protein [Planctomycetes bacterium]|nr:FAD binding domain-containing protein [Planctomycetota bacterium]
MKAFTYKSAKSEEEAVKALGPGALPLAGGTTLLNLMKDRVVEPEVLVNLKSIKGFDRIEAVSEGLRIGAGVTLAALLENPVVAKQYPAIAQALETVATPQIRNMATIGGNLCTRPPCWYFSHDLFACAKRGNANTCPAREGENEFSAIFANEGPCVAVHGSSAAPAFIAFGGSVRIAGPNGARDLPLEKFFALHKDNVLKENVLANNEIVTHVSIGKGNPKSATYVVLQKESHDWPVGLASVVLQMNGDTCASAKIVLGAVAPIPWRAAAAEAALAGKKITMESASAAAEAAVKGAAPLSQNGYKVQTSRAAVKRAILLAAEAK